MKTRTILSRRELLRRGLRVATTLGAAVGFGHLGRMSAFAQSSGSNYKALVCVFLFGGNDGNNMVIPVTGANATNYTKGRGSLALSNPLALGDSGYGLHPNMTALANLYKSGILAVQANVGTLVQPMTRSEYTTGSVKAPSNLFSHADQQQEWQTAAPLENITTGWGGRISDLTTATSTSGFPVSVSVAGNSTLLAGQTTSQATVSGDGFGLLGEDGSAATTARDASLQQLFKLDSGVTLLQSASGVLQNAIEVANLVSSAASTSALPVTFPQTSIGNQLAEVTQLIRARTQLGAQRQIFFTSLGGFDTHTSQLGLQASLLQQLSDAMAAFYTAMSDSSIAAANQVTVFTESEFSRTFQPNTNGGTDHAWGSHHLIVGGGVNGGVYGSFPSLVAGGDSDAEGRGNWIPTTSLDQYGATFANWFGVSQSNLTTVFPNLANFSGQQTLSFL
jgi:uncharacterized protein (DUF1501 family)